jgi:hypothetical protein
VTPIDLAHSAQAADPDDPALRLRLYERVLDAELLLVLAAEPAGDELHPLALDLAQGALVLAFDRDDRLADFLGAPAPFADLSGRRLVGLLAGRGAGLALNPGAPSATILDRDAVDWLAGMAAQAPAEAAARASRFARPDPAPALLAAVGPKLAAMAGRIASAHLVAAHYPDAPARPLLALAGVSETDRPGVAAAIAEAVRFSGAEDAALDVAFPDPGTPLETAARRVGLRLDLPPPAAPDPGRLPRLR